MADRHSQSSHRQPRAVRIFVLAAMIAVLGGAWYYGWLRGAAELERRADTALAAWSAMGIEIDCDDRRIEGFPFRIGIFCNSLTSYNLNDSSVTRAGAFRSAAQFYDPGKIVAELDGPAKFERTGTVPVLIGWEALRASARTTFSGLTAISVEGTGLAMSDGWADAAPPFASASAVQLHARQSPANVEDLELAFSVSGLRPAGNRIPPFSVIGNLDFASLAAALTGNEFDPGDYVAANGVEGGIEQFDLRPAPGGELRLRGAFSISRGGLLSADLIVDVENAAAFSAFLGQVMPRAQDTLSTVEAAFKLLSDAGGSIREVPVRIAEGEISIGPFRLGELPPLFGPPSQSPDA